MPASWCSWFCRASLSVDDLDMSMTVYFYFGLVFIALVVFLVDFVFVFVSRTQVGHTCLGYGLQWRTHGYID